MKNTYSVGQVNRYIKNMFTQDYLLQKIYVKGEVSNCKYHTSGHIYFSLKDETGTLNCVMFAGHRRGLAFAMKNGDKVIVGGSVDVYERDGRYQMYAKEITLEGAGTLYERYLALKQELEDMGMFAQEYKQPIPRFIRRLGVVTAPTGAAVQDIRNISYRRNPYLQIILYPALVQGAGAAESIVKGIQMLDKTDVDVIIVGRGGGSIEDLWAFNEEIVARAIFECSTPIISAVGHETDFTIADFVADLRAPTPSAAAELAVDDYRSVIEAVSIYRQRLYRAMSGKMDLYRSRLEHFQTKFAYLSPENRLREQRQRLADLENAVQNGMNRKLQDERHRLSVYLERFAGLSPLKKLNQGYSYVADKYKKTLTSVEQVQNGDTIYISETGRWISAYADDAGKCIVMQEIEKGKVISCGVQLGASYVAKNIPHVPYEQRNKEMYPIIQARSTLLEDLLGVCGKPVSGICERGIEAGVFETGMVLVNHRSTPYEIGNLKGNRKFTNPVNDTVLLPHSAVWIERE